MKILALETSASACSIALSIGNKIISKHISAQAQQTQIILPMIDELLLSANIKGQELDAIAFGQGPGSFTGVRIATSVAQGLAFGWGCLVIPVSSLAAIAHEVHAATGFDNILVAIDARMNEIYCGAYQYTDNNIHCHYEAVVKPKALDNPFAEYYAAGNGWEIYAEELKELAIKPLHIFAEMIPQATSILALAKDVTGIPAAAARPIYLRDNVAKKKQ